MGQAHGTPTRFLQWALTGAMALVLAACGGGGGGTPAPVTAGSPGQAPTVVQPSHFAVTTDASSPPHTLVIDTRSGQIVQDLATPYLNKVLDRYDTQSTASPSPSLGAGYLLYVQNGKVYQQDLSGDTLGTPQQISSIVNACRITGGTYDLARDGKHAWLRVRLQDTTGACPTSSTGTVKFVSTNMPTTEVGPTADPITGGPQGSTMVTILRNAQQQALGLLMRDNTTQDLAVYDNALKTVLYTVKSQAVSTSSKPVFWVASWAGTQQGLLQLDSQLYPADWRSGTLTLGAPVFTLASPGTAIYSAANAQAIYFANGNDIQVVAPGGAPALFVTVEPSLGVIGNLTLTSHALLVPQSVLGTDANGLPVLTSQALQAYNTQTKTRATLAASSANSVLPLQVDGDTVLLQKSTLSGLTSDLIRSDALNPSPQTVATGVNVFSLNALQSTMPVLWFTSGGTTGSQVVAYSTGQNTQTAVGTLPLDQTPSFLALFSSWTGSVTGFTNFDTHGVVTQWLMDVTKVDSLKLVSP